MIYHIKIVSLPPTLISSGESCVTYVLRILRLYLIQMTIVFASIEIHNYVRLKTIVDVNWMSHRIEIL